MNDQEIRVSLGPTPPPTIGFRLDLKNRNKLAQRAARLGISRHELARSFTITALEEKEILEVLAESCNELQSKLTTLREEILNIAEVLIVAAGKATEKEAAEWIKTFKM